MSSIDKEHNFHVRGAPRGPQRDILTLSSAKPIKSLVSKHLSNVHISFEPSSEVKQKYVWVLKNIVPLLRKSIFSKSVAKLYSYFELFYYQNLIFVQNKHDIRDQHEKLHQITYISSKNIFRQNSTCGGPHGKSERKGAEGEYTRILTKNIF